MLELAPIWHGIVLSTYIYFVSVLLHWMLPGTISRGYACSDDPEKISDPPVLIYKINGWFVTLAILGFLFYIASGGQFIDNFWSAATSYYRYSFGCIVGGNLWGIVLSILCYRRGIYWCEEHGYVKWEPIRCVTRDQKRKIRSRKLLLGGRDQQSVKIKVKKRQRELRSWMSFYKGIGEFNPRLYMPRGKLDIKMWLYLAGTLMLELQVLALAGAHTVLYNGNEMSRVVRLTTGCWTWFCFDYLLNEHIHLYTYDIFAERVGLKLVWGCLGVYPFLYPIGQWCLVREILPHQDISTKSEKFFIGLFLIGWIFTRGANYQKYMFKRHPKKKEIMEGAIDQIALTVKLPDDTERHFLVSGFWGMARHVNYMGEIIQGLALGLPIFMVTKSPLAMIYPIFIASLLIPRQADDDKLCRAKYGDKAWNVYVQHVPYKIVPGIY